MAVVTLPDNLGLTIRAAFETYPEAQQLACEIFTCAIIAIGRTDGGKLYVRPVDSQDQSIFAYAVISL